MSPTPKEPKMASECDACGRSGIFGQWALNYPGDHLPEHEDVANANLCKDCHSVRCGRAKEKNQLADRIRSRKQAGAGLEALDFVAPRDYGFSCNGCGTEPHVRAGSRVVLRPGTKADWTDTVAPEFWALYDGGEATVPDDSEPWCVGLCCRDRIHAELLALRASPPESEAGRFKVGDRVQMPGAKPGRVESIDGTVLYVISEYNGISYAWLATSCTRLGDSAPEPLSVNKTLEGAYTNPLYFLAEAFRSLAPHVCICGIPCVTVWSGQRLCVRCEGARGQLLPAVEPAGAHDWYVDPDAPDGCA